MNKIMLIDAQHQQETRVVISDDGHIEDFDHVTSAKAQIKGNIYLAKITRVEPSLQAAFVEYGGNKQGFLPFSEIHPDYYQIPVEDRKRLLEEELEEAAREEEAEEAEIEQKQSGGRHRRRNRFSRNRRGAEGAASTELEEGLSTATSEGDEPVDRAQLVAESYVLASDIGPDDAEELQRFQKESEIDDEASEGDVETVSSDDSDEMQRLRRGASFKRYRIQEVIKRNQIVLVQVIKEERGNKGCSLTTYISLAGRYCVLMPNSPKGGGVSRKIGNGDQRRKLKEVVAELKEKRGLSAIIRTAGIDRTKTEIKRDYEYLVKLWNQIREDTIASNAPALIYEESDIIKRSIRDVYTQDIEQILVQGDQAYKDAKAFMKLIMPSHAARVKQYKDRLPIFAAYGIEAQLSSMYEPTARLASGGYIVLQPTEALISIDVNSGRSTTERNVEETAVKTNLEAAYEIARQLRLRDLAGLIVIDFIDMYYGKNRRTLERAMKDALKLDRAKIQISRISAFGLMELSRQRLRPSIAESSTIVCPHCLGVGYVRSVETVAIQIIRLLEREAASAQYMALRVASTADVVLHLMNERRSMIQAIESEYAIRVEVSIDQDIAVGEFRIIKLTEDGKEIVHREQSDGSQRRKSSRRGRRGGKGRHLNDDSRFDMDGEVREEDQAIEGDEPVLHQKNSQSETISEEVESDTSSESSAQGQREGRSRRSRRGGRNRRNQRGERANLPRNVDAPSPSQQDHVDEIDAQQPAESSSIDHPPVTVVQNIPVEVVEPVREAKPRRRRATTERSSTRTSLEVVADDNAQSAVVVDNGNSEPKEKRKGWWNRVLEG